MQLELVNQLMAVASATKSVGDAVDESLGIVLDVLGEQVGAAYLLATGEAQGPQLVAQRGMDPSRVDELRGLKLAGKRCYSSARLVTLGGEPPREGSVEQLVAAMGCRIMLIVPLVARGEPVGCLFLGPSAKISSAQLGQEFFNTIGRAIGLAVDNSRLYEQMARRLRQSQALYRVSLALASTLDLDNLLTLIVRSAVDTIPKANNGTLHLLDEETGELHPRALSFEREVRPDVSGRSQMRVGHGVAGHALETGQVVDVPDVSADPRFVRGARPFASLLVAPLVLGDRRIGTLSIDSPQKRAFSSEDEQLLMTLATQAAAAIENARLVSDLQQSLRDLQTTQAQLIQSEKLSAIGRLIAGVAHELNNPLTAVIGYAQLLRSTEGIGESLRRDLDKICSQAQRASKIVQNLLTFARQHRAERRFVDVNEVLRNTLDLRAYQLEVEGIEVTTRLDDRRLGTSADPYQLQQVFLNLINNAQDAIFECRHNGHLVISSELCGDKIQVRFTDDGAGLSSSAERHLFEPFFTTKEVGKGTGLGLSICFGIVSQHGGHIWTEKSGETGTTFVVELLAAQQEPTESAETEDELMLPARGKLVLVVEDEEDVATLLERFLSRDGHHVYLAPNGQAALVTWRRLAVGEFASTWSSAISGCPAWTAQLSTTTSGRRSRSWPNASSLSPAIR